MRMDLNTYCDNTVTYQELDLFRDNSRIICCGTSNSGKTKLILDLILFYRAKFSKIFVIGTTYHEISSYKPLKDKTVFLKHFPSLEELDEISDNKQHKLIFMDDVYYKAFNDINVLTYYSHGRHYNVSCILISQNIFYTNGKFSRDISLNASHYIILRTRDTTQLKVLSRQLFGSENINKILHVYQFLIKKYKFAHLLVDISGNIDERIELRSHIIPNKDNIYQTVYIQN